MAMATKDGQEPGQMEMPQPEPQPKRASSPPTAKLHSLLIVIGSQGVTAQARLKMIGLEQLKTYGFGIGDELHCLHPDLQTSFPSIQADGRCGSLYVEDNTADVEAVRSIFNEHCPDIEVQVATAAEEAIQALGSRPDVPDVVLLDLRVPPWTGIEGVRAIRYLLEHEQTLIVIFSGMEDPAAIRDAYDAGANCYLFKPSDLAELTSVLIGAATYFCVLAACSSSARR